MGHGIQGSQSTWVTETVSMASVPPDPVPLLVSLKAVDPAEYPFYGTADAGACDDAAAGARWRFGCCGGGVSDPAECACGPDAAAGRAQFQDRGGVEAGAGPDYGRSGNGAARDDLAGGSGRTGLIAPGSRASATTAGEIAGKRADRRKSVRKQLEAALPDAQVMDFREGNPALSRGLDNATSILSLICLVAMVLGAIGVAMAMHAHLEQRMDMLAILKAMGAGSADLLRIFLLQTLGAWACSADCWAWPRALA